MNSFSAVLVTFAVAATVLASPPAPPVADQLPKGAMFHVIASTADPRTPALPSTPEAEARPAGPFLGGWLDHLAVVKPHRPGRDRPPTLQMFVLVAPLKGQIGILAVGVF